MAVTSGIHVESAIIETYVNNDLLTIFTEDIQIFSPSHVFWSELRTYPSSQEQT